MRHAIATLLFTLSACRAFGSRPPAHTHTPTHHSEAAVYEPKKNPEEERCRDLIDQYYRDLDVWRAAQAQIPSVSDEERENFAHQQGKARQDDTCYIRLRESRQGATYTQVPCGRPALEYRSQKGLLKAPHLPRECAQYDDKAAKEALRVYETLK